jgi:hypothetical protein
MILGYRSYKMSISNNYRRQRRKVFSTSSESASRASILIALVLLAASTLALISSAITPVTITTAFAQEENNTTLTPTPNNYPVTTTTATSEIDLSPQPIYQDQVRGVSETQINQTHTLSTVSGNGTLSLPSSTEPIRTTSSGNLIVSLEGTVATAAGEQIVITEDGSENATATLYEIARFNMQDGTGRGIAIAVVHTNSTGLLAPLDGMILAGQEEFRADGSRLVTMWEWESGIPLPTGNVTATTMEESSPPSPMNATTTTMTTDATTSESNATAATGEEGELQEEIMEEAVGGAEVAE